MILVIISHTAHYKTPTDEIVGWGPTVTEINQLIHVFDKIYHCAFIHDERPPESSLAYSSPCIKFVPLPPTGGNDLKGKLKVLVRLPETLIKIRRVLRKSDIFQFRAPTGMGVYLIPYLTLFHRQKGWFKYAGNWKQKNPPFGYAMQRCMLSKQSRIVTVNGLWLGQPKNVLAFDNPCLTPKDREKGKKAVERKTLEKVNKICFVGNLTKNKGFDLFMDALIELENIQLEVDVIGDGPMRKIYEKKLPGVIFHGFLPKEKVQEVYLQCHFIVLPSLSEGFPKVVAEGMNFGCIPIVSDVSGIGQYIIDGENGFLIKPITKERLVSILKETIKLKNDEYKQKVKFNYNLASKFTFEAYIKHIKQSIL